MPDIDEPQDEEIFDEDETDETPADEGEEGEVGEDLWEGGEDENILDDQEEDIES